MEQTLLRIFQTELRVNVGEGLTAIEFLAHLVGQGLQLQHPFPQVWVVVIEMAQFFSFGVTSKAAEWFTRSAEAGNQYAQYMLGKLYLTGQGVAQDQAQAMAWFSRSAAQGNQYAQFFLEHQNSLRPPSVMLAVTRLLYHMSRIFEDHTLPHSSTGLQVDSKLRRKIQAKKIAMGHKPDDHEEEQNQGGMVMGGM